MDELYDLVTRDDRIKHFFQGAKLDAVKASQSTEHTPASGVGSLLPCFV